MPIVAIRFGRKKMKGTLMRRRLLVVLLLASMAGCASYEPPAPKLDHPAHPKAQPGTVEPLPSTLEIDRNNLPSSPPELQEEDMKQMNGGVTSQSCGDGAVDTEKGETRA
jgi:hypothetical protein